MKKLLIASLVLAVPLAEGQQIQLRVERLNDDGTRTNEVSTISYGTNSSVRILTASGSFAQLDDHLKRLIRDWVLAVEDDERITRKRAEVITERDQAEAIVERDAVATPE